MRQINPSFIQNGRVTSQAFRPTPKDENELSVYNGDLISPEKSWLHFTVTQSFKSAGVMAVSHEQCIEQSVPVIYNGIPFAEHAYLSFSNMSKKEIERKAKVLMSKAQERNWLYQA
jgi:hypothetical protein